MSTKKPKALILKGCGLWGDVELQTAFQLSGFDTEIRHLQDLIREHYTTEMLCSQYSTLAIPGGHSFSDDLGEGRIAAIRIQKGLNWDLNLFAERGGLVLGVGNGFQILIHLGVFGKDLSLASNQSGSLLSQWVKATPSGTRSVWLKGVGTLDLPVSHAEGRLVIAAFRRSEILSKMERHGQLCLRYEENPNGSDEDLAGLCDVRGRILGMMPRPELFVRWTQHPEWTAAPARANAPGQGLRLFENAYLEAMKTL